MRMKATACAVGVVLSALLVVSLTTAPGGASAPPSTAVKEITLTTASSGSTVLATKGELVVVRLSGDHLRWSEATAVETTPVLTRVSGSMTTTGSSVTVFRVTNYGTAGLSATGTPLCAAAVACPPFVVLWHATVDVPVVDPPPPANG